MGNHLAGLAPSQIFPVEHYLTDLNDVHYDTSLGSTRFLKVARARSSSGHVVVKVFTIHDPSLDLRSHVDKVVDIRKALEGCLNCLPFQKVLLTERAGFVVRQYVKQSLYDRMSTRPFLTTIEKKWMAFQLLLALQQAQKHGVCHGDIKLENVMVTSWNWIFLTDFASFKPIYLPEDNPADFSFYFDTSRKRACYIAPERFKMRCASSETNIAAGAEGSFSNLEKLILNEVCPDGTAQGALPGVVGEDTGELVHSMDIFSVGCVLIELFTDCVPFHFSDLLAYRAGEYYPEKILNKVEDNDIREMLEHMIQKDPSQRFSANEYLSKQRGKVFPEYFYKFLQSYMQIYSSDNSMMPDEKVTRSHDNLEKILSMLNSEPNNDQFDTEGLGLIATLITSNMRSLKFQNSKIGALKSLSRIAEYVPCDITLDRILPHVIVFLSDPFSSVRVMALECLLNCVKYITEVPLSDGNIFPEYILPNIIPLCHDRNQYVRSVLAQHMAETASEASRFLDFVMEGPISSDSPNSLLTYDMELAALHNSFGQMVTILLSDQVNGVKQSLMEYGVTKLAIFFGKLKANDILLSHMITFLNDKEDPYLRSCFYQNIVGLAAMVGQECTQILTPLLLQGLTDSEEIVIVDCIEATTNLITLQLLEKQLMLEFIEESAPFLLHPNMQLRLSVASLIVATARNLKPIEISVKLSPIVRPFLIRPVAQFDVFWIVLSSLSPPISRRIYELVIKSGSMIRDLLDVLEERQTKRNSMNPTIQTQHSEVDQNVRQIFRRLVSDGMNSDLEDKLLLMKDVLLKISLYQQSTSRMRDSKIQGNEDCSTLNINDLTRECDIKIQRESLLRSSEDNSNQSRSIVEHQAIVTPLNEEWQHMIGLELNSEEPNVKIHEAIIAAEENHPISTEKSQKSDAAKNEQKFNDRTSNCAPCKVSLDNLLRRKRGEFGLISRKTNQIGYQLSNHHLPPAGWRPKSKICAHMHEHDGAIVKIVRFTEKSIFASAAQDGCVRLWNCPKIDSRNIANRAKKIFDNHDGSPLTSLASCSHPFWIAASAENGLICVNSVETSTTLHKRHINVKDQGAAMELCFQETGSSPVLVYGTAFGNIIGWDFRMPNKDAFKLSNGLSNGIQTALSVSDDQTWVACGTSSGHLSCWDLRFQLQIVNCAYPSEGRIRQLLVQPGGHSQVLVAAQGHNEIGFWNMESQCRDLVLWPSAAPVLSKSPPTGHSVTSMQSIMTPGMRAVISAGTDMRIRFWDLDNKHKSYIISGSGNEIINPKNVSYNSRLVDGVEVVQEFHTSPKEANRSSPNAQQQTPPISPPVPTRSNGDFLQAKLKQPSLVDCEMLYKPGLDITPPGHTDYISGLTICQAYSNWYIITGSREGALKIWT